MAKGGKRDGAGRKVGVPNKRTAEKAAEVEASGLTPLDYMLGILRDEKQPTLNRFEAAKAAAPYVHAKLANVDVNHGLQGDLSTLLQKIDGKSGRIPTS